MKINFLIPLIAGLGLLCACKGKNKAGYEVVNNSSADSVQSDSITSPQPKLIKTADIRFKVQNVQEASEQITGLTQTFNGSVMHKQIGSSIQSSRDARISNDSVMRITSLYTSADITVKIPSEKLNDFMNKIIHMSMYVSSQRINITDKSLEYLSARLKLKNRTELVNQQKQGKVTIKDPANVLQLKDDMIDEQIGNHQIDDDVKNSVVTLSFYQSNTIFKEIIANDDPSAYNTPFFTRIAWGFSNGIGLFGDFFVALVNMWLFIAAGIGLWLIYRYYKTKKALVAKELPGA